VAPQGIVGATHGQYILLHGQQDFLVRQHLAAALLRVLNRVYLGAQLGNLVLCQLQVLLVVGDPLLIHFRQPGSESGAAEQVTNQVWRIR